MKTARLVRHSLREATRFRLRAAFLMLGSLVGVAALSLVLSIGAAAERKVNATVRQIFGGSSLLLITGGGRLLGGPRAGAARLTLDEVESAVAEIPGVAAWDPQQALSNETVRQGDASVTARILGQTERYERVWDRGVTRGVGLEASDVAGSARVALLGETVARRLFGADDPLGREVLIGPVRFRVVGLLEPFGTDIHGLDRDAEVVVPISTLMRRVLNVDTIGGAKILLADPARVEPAAGELKRLLRSRHALAPGAPDDFAVITSTGVQRTLRQVERALFVFLPLAAGVILLACGAVAASLSLAAVSARVGEIGLRRAVGATPADIQAQFLLESALTSLAGGLLGLAAGGALALWVAQRFTLGDVFSWTAIAAGLAAALATGLLAGVLPARRAAQLQPVDALR